MKKVGGNITATLQKKTTSKNPIGEDIATWSDVASLVGWLDFASGQADYNNYKAKLEESSHIFISDYVNLPKNEGNYRMIINGDVYEVVYFDNPMLLNYHSEIYLKYVGV